MELQAKQIWIALSIVCGAAAYIFYLRGIYQRHLKPHCFSWLLGGLMTWIAFAAQIQDHAGLGKWTNFFTAFMCSLIGVLAIKYGEKNITKTDWCALIGCLFCILLWVVTDDPTLSIILLVIIDVGTMYPTYRKTYHKPSEESALTASLNALKFILGFMALDKYTISSALFLLTNVLLCGGSAMLILHRRAQVLRSKK